MYDSFWDDPDCVEFYLDMKGGLYDNAEDEEEEQECES